MNESRRHHYVPEFHQKGFADIDERLWLYDRQTQRFNKVHPRNICCERELYTVDPNGRKIRDIESKWLSQIDGAGAGLIRKFEDGIDGLEIEDKETLSIFVGQQITRTPAFRDMMTRFMTVIGEEFLRAGFTNVDRARQMLEQYGEKAGVPTGTTMAESLVDAVVGGHLRVGVSEMPFLEFMIDQVDHLAKAIAFFNWEVLEAPADTTGFIICDYPFVIVPPGGFKEPIGLQLRGAVKYFPLSRRLCLRMGEQGYSFSYRRVGKEDVRIINQNIVVNSERFVMGPSREQLENTIDRSGAYKLDPTSRGATQVVQRDGDRSLIMSTFWPGRRYFQTKGL